MAQQIAKAAEDAAGAAAESSIDDAVVERWARSVVAQVAEVAEALEILMLRPSMRSVEEYARQLDEAIETGGIFGRVQIAGERIARATNGINGRVTALRELWSIIETLEVYGWMGSLPRHLP